MPNTGTRNRRTLILMYAPFWRKSGLERSARQLLAAGGELSPLQRQLMALDQRDGGGNIYDEEWLAAHPRPDIR